MTKIMFITIITLFINVSLWAQDEGQLAERMRLLMISMPFSPQAASQVAERIQTFTANIHPAPTENKDEQAIHNIIATLQKGWNEKSGETFASSFYKKHDYIVINGLYLSGISVEINARSHQGIFNSIYKTTDLELRLDKINFVRPDLALVHVLGATYQHGTPVPENPMAIISMLVEKKEGEWKIISFHNCNIEVSFDPAAPNQGPIPLKVMYASWYKK
ncbi:MAG: SgcJ/EcaC family oxidoreductase [Ferruginibacter sp.]